MASAIVSLFFLAVIAIFFVFDCVGNPCVLHKWGKWSKYLVVNKTNHMWGEPPKKYGESVVNEKRQERDCIRCNKHQDRKV